MHFHLAASKKQSKKETDTKRMTKSREKNLYENKEEMKKAAAAFFLAAMSLNSVRMLCVLGCMCICACERSVRSVYGKREFVQMKMGF